MNEKNVTVIRSDWYEIRRVDNNTNEIVGSFGTNNRKMAYSCYQQWINGNVNLDYTIELWTENYKGKLVKISSLNGLTKMTYRDMIESSKERK